MRGDDRELIPLIREALPAVDEPSVSIDLWSRMERRLEDRRSQRPGQLDWALAALAVALLAVFPEALLLVLYHL